MNENILEVVNLRKIYNHRNDSVVALDDVSFKVKRGEIFGLLGPNGAGKTTTIGVLTTKTIPSGGKAFLGGIEVAKNPLEIKKRIAIVPQNYNLDRGLSVRDNLIFHAKYFGVSKEEREQRADYLLEEMDLYGRRNDQVLNFSDGMKRRLMIARALMHDPEIIFLDEATIGLDPEARLLIWRKIKELNNKGVTVFLTTHYMEEADRLCDHVAIMDKGKILVLDSPDQLKSMLPDGNIIELRLENINDEFLSSLEGIKGIKKIETGIDVIKLFTDGKDNIVQEVFGLVFKFKLPVLAIQHYSPTLEDLFIYLTGKGLHSGD
ncbi:MAG: ATP-binding cassette domain-containing protein [Actinobacteria bacterium]|nr:ATP-binding cassette domain-containing protein [Actinomycetota bacterium]